MDGMVWREGGGVSQQPGGGGESKKVMKRLEVDGVNQGH